MIDSEPSKTSTVVALGTFCVVQDLKEGNWDPRVRAILEAILRSAPQPFAFLARMSTTPFFRQMFEKVMSWFIPGMFSHYVARKKYIEKRVRSAVEVGCRQFVVLGGGLDTLALRLAADAPDVKVFEIDHPATQQLKLDFLKSVETNLSNLTLIATNLTEHSVSEALAASAFDSVLPSVFVAEGILMYLREEQVREVLRDLLSIAATGSKIVLTCMEINSEGEITFRGSRKSFVNVWLDQQHEPFLWGLDLIQAKYFFASCGWKLVSMSRWDELFAAVPGLPHWMHPPARGEHIVVLEPAI
ncbi:MAG: hypothetical protein RIR26_1929 [Pseudomonadota bacterium]|jgi:methyltransferase (TIGR00027 family)